MNDKNCDCAGFFNALNGALALFALIVHPFLTIGVLILWAVAAAWRDRPHRPTQKPLTLEEAYRAVGREPPPAPDTSKAAHRRELKLAVLMLAVALTSGFPLPGR
jgi:hypothetical protein